MKIRNILIMLTLLLPFLGCEKEAYYFNIPDSIELKAEKNDINFDVKSSGNWTMTVSDNWFKITPKHGTGDKTLRLVTDYNTSGNERTATLEFKTEKETKKITVTQPAFIGEVPQEENTEQ